MSSDVTAATARLGGRGRRLAVATALTAAVLVTGACTSQGAEPSSTEPVSTIAPVPDPSTTASSGPAAAEHSTGLTTGGTATGSSSPAVGSEGQPSPSAAPTALVPGLQVRRLTGTLPPNATASGTIVAGFPTTIVPVIDGATVVQTSVTSQGDRLQLGLTASSPQSPEAVTAAYVAVFAAEGFQSGPAPANQGSTATNFIRGAEGLVLTVTVRVGGGTDLSLVGTLVRVG